MKLDIGCGKQCKPGFEGVDINPACGAKYQCPAWDIPVESGSVEEIHARHFLEHLTPDLAKKTLLEWRRILKDDGTILIIVPDLEYHCAQLARPGMSPFVDASNFTHAMAGLYGWIDTAEPNQYMAHMWGYTRESIRKLAEGMGYSCVYPLTRKCDISVVLRKKITASCTPKDGP